MDEVGLLTLHIKRGTNKAADFAAFLESVAINIQEPRAYHKDEALLFFDNARIHIAGTVKVALMEHGLWAMSNCPYAPELNPCELFINHHKDLVKSEMGKLR